MLFYGLNGTLIKGGSIHLFYDGIFLIITMSRKLVILRIILRGELLFFRNRNRVIQNHVLIRDFGAGAQGQ